MSRWWRAYDEALHDPKVQLLEPPLFKLWFNILCIASKNGGTLPDTHRLAFDLRVTEAKAQETVTSLVAEKLLDVRKDKQIEPHNWSHRQYLSDQSTERVKRHRQKRLAAGLEAQWFAPKKLRLAVYERDNFKCVYCGSGGKLSLDHRTPEIRGGTHDISNLATACISCNGSKRDLTEEEFRARPYFSNGLVTVPQRPEKRTQNTEQNTDKIISLNSDWPKDFRERFWEAYPRRVGKKAAIRKLEVVWREGEVGFAVLLSAVRAIDTKDPKFIPFPLTWLNQGRYLDHSPTQLSSSLPTKIFVEVDTPQWRAWAAHKPGGYPETDRRVDGGLTGQRGWFFETEWPPEQQKQAEQL